MDALTIWYLVCGIVIGLTVLVGVVGAYVVWRFKIRHKREALIVKKGSGDSYEIVAKKSFKLTDKEIVLKGNVKQNEGDKRFTIDLEGVALRGVRLTQLIFDYATGKILFLGGAILKGDPNDVDLATGSGVVDRLVERLKTRPKSDWVLLGLAVGFGVFLGIVVGIYLAPSLVPVSSVPVPTNSTVPVRWGV